MANERLCKFCGVKIYQPLNAYWWLTPFTQYRYCAGTINRQHEPEPISGEASHQSSDVDLSGVKCLPGCWHNSPACPRFTGEASTGEQPPVCELCAAKVPHEWQFCRPARPVRGTEEPDSRMRCSECNEPVCDHLAKKLLPWLSGGGAEESVGPPDLHKLCHLLNLESKSVMETEYEKWASGLQRAIILIECWIDGGYNYAKEVSSPAAAPSLTPRCPACKRANLLLWPEGHPQQVSCSDCHRTFECSTLAAFAQFFQRNEDAIADLKETVGWCAFCGESSAKCECPQPL